MKIGIFLNYNHMTVLKAEGLGRYIGQLIKGFSKAGNDVTVICPKWSKNDIKSLLEDLEVDGENLNLITTKRIPFFLYLYEKLSNSKKKKRTAYFPFTKNIHVWLNFILIYFG